MKQEQIASAILNKNPMIEVGYNVQTIAALDVIEFFVSLGMTYQQAVEIVK